MKVSARSAVVLIALALTVAAGGSAYVYWRLRPPPMPAQVIYGSGRIEADEVRVGLEVAGRLLDNRAVEGQVLNAGDILARIDPSDYELQSERADALRTAALRSASQIDAQIALAGHHAMTARADLDRYETLANQGWVTAQRLDLVRNAYVASVDQAVALKQQRAGADAQAQVAAKSLELARSQLAKTRLTVPLTGAVLERLAEPGEVVAAGQPIAVLANLSTVKLKVFVGERDLGKVRLGVDVAASNYWRQAVVAPGPAHETVANLVDGDSHTGLTRPAKHQIPPLLVEVRQRQAADTALGRSTDFGQLHKRGPKAITVNANGRNVSSSCCSHSFTPIVCSLSRPVWRVPCGSYALRFAKSSPNTHRTGRVLVFGLLQIPCQRKRYLLLGCGWPGADFAKRSAYEVPGHPQPSRQRCGNSCQARLTAVGFKVCARRDAAAKFGLNAGRLI